MGLRGSNREIEEKLVVEGIDQMYQVDNLLYKKLRNKARIVEGSSTDVYWRPKGKADFIRVRYRGNYKDSQMTLKYSDKGNINDRIEIDVDIDNPMNAALMFEHMFGKPIGTIKKRYSVYFMDKDDSNISVYQVENDKRVFIEIEALDMERVKKLKRKLLSIVPYKLIPQNKSLCQLILQNKLKKR
jgi:adenylate cyclase class IV